MSEPLEIRDPEIDAEELTGRLRRRLDDRRQAGTLPPDPPEFALNTPPDISDPTLRYHLEQMNARYDKTFVDLALKPSPVAHVPVLGRLWLLIRKQAHQLVRYYLDVLASKQAKFNEHTTAALNRLIVLEKQNLALEETVAALNDRVTELEARVGTRTSHDG